MSPFRETYPHITDSELVKASLGGSKDAIEALISRHQRFLYNVALKLVRDPNDAADLTQEVLIKVVTKLSQFEGKSRFRTWMYRIAVNHFLMLKRRAAEEEVRSFDQLGSFISNSYNTDDFTLEEQKEHESQIQFIRNRCMTSMLLCLDRQQRLVFILGAIFNIKSGVAARILNITAENFRQQLSRAKKDLFQFMDNKCGLINPQNPCRCSKKTKGFMQEGRVDKTTGVFKPAVIQNIQSQVDGKNRKLNDLMDGKYLSFFRQQPYEEYAGGQDLVASLIVDPAIIQLFHLN